MIVNEYTDNTFQTLNSGDQINGGGGVNTLNAVLKGSAKPVLTNVQNVNVQSIATSTLDLTTSTGVEQINIDAVVAGTNIDGVQEADVAISNLKQGTIGLNNIDGKEFTLGLDKVGTAKTTAAIDLDTNSVETLTIDNGDGANFVNLTGSANAKTVTAIGDGNLTADLTNVLASNKVNITVGAGDDKITVTNAQLEDTTSNIDLGEGNNTLIVTGVKLGSASASSVINNLSQKENDRDIAELNGVDTLVLANGASAAWSGSSEIVLKDSGLTGLVLNAQTVSVSSSGTVTTADAALGKVTLTDASEDFTLGLSNVSATSASSEAITFTNSGEIKVETLTINANGIGEVSSSGHGVTVTAANIKDLTINDVNAGTGSKVNLTIKATASSVSNLRTIDLSGKENTQIKINASDISESNTALQKPVIITIGELNTLDYIGITASSSSSKMVSEIFKFTDSSFSKITIAGFDISKTTGSGATAKIVADKLDLSDLGISSTDELVLESYSSNVVITAKDGQFNGEIVLSGVSAVTEDSFIF